MFHTIVFFGFLGVVPVVHGPYQISGDPSDPLEGHMRESVIQICKISVDIYIQCFQLPVVLLLQIVHVSLRFPRICVPCNSYCH